MRVTGNQERPTEGTKPRDQEKPRGTRNQETDQGGKEKKADQEKLRPREVERLSQEVETERS
jgi:hypothetical protein